MEEIARPEKGAIRIGPFGSALKKHEYSEAGVRVLGIEDVFPNRLESGRRKFIPVTKYRDLAQYEVAPGDLLITNMGTVGRTCVVPHGLEKSIISSHLIKLALNLDVAWPPYVAWMLNFCPLVVAQIEAKSHGAIMAGFNSALLKQLRVPLPPLTEQRRIAQIMGRAEALRAARRAAIIELDALVWSVFVEMFGDPTTNPLQWPHLQLRDVVTRPLRNGRSPSRTGEVRAKVLTLSAITGKQFDPDAWKSDSFAEDLRVDQTVDHRDLLVCRGNGSLERVGRAYFPPATMPDIGIPDTIIAARVGDRIVPRFLETVWNSKAVRRQIESMARTTNGTYKVNQGVLEKISFIAPPLELQRSFASRAEIIEHARSSQLSSLALVDALFTSLQQRAPSGQL